VLVRDQLLETVRRTPDVAMALLALLGFGSSRLGVEVREHGGRIAWDASATAARAWSNEPVAAPLGTRKLISPPRSASKPEMTSNSSSSMRLSDRCCNHATPAHRPEISTCARSWLLLQWRAVAAR